MKLTTLFLLAILSFNYTALGKQIEWDVEAEFGVTKDNAKPD